MSRPQELSVAEYFSKWLLNTTGTEYKVEEELVERSEIDCYLVKKDGAKLGLQVVTSDGEVVAMAFRNSKQSSIGQAMIVGTVQTYEWINNCIKDKERKYSKKDKESLILLVEGGPPTRTPDYINKTPYKYDSSDFRGIYFVSLPLVSYPEVENGYVVPLKIFE